MAKVLSSISGNLISAASAGFAPTNSADVSAIASAYQVVSATATQLYAGTAHVTSINGAPISASRAGNAANASMANSAYYDGTGRLISSLPDSATVSSIASSYAPTFGLNAGKISSINGSALDTPTGSQVVTATGSSWIGSEIGISSINGSALSAKAAYSATRAAEDDFGASFRYDYAKQSAFTSVSSTVANNSAIWGQGGSVTSPSGTIVVMNDNEIEGTNSAVLTASAGDGFSSELTPVRNYIDHSWYRLYDGILPASGATLTLHTDPIWGSNVYFSGKKLDGTISLFDVSVSGGNGATSLTVDLGEIAREISAYATTYVAINGKMTAEKVGGIQVTGVGELAWKSAVDNVTNTVSSNSATWGQGGVDSATVSAIASSYAESAVSSKADSSSLSSYALSADVSSTIDTVSSNSASWGQGGPVTATASAAAIAYTSTGTAKSSFTGISSVNGSALLVSNMLPNAQQATGDAHFHFMPTTSPWGSTEYAGLLGPLQYATGAALAMKQTNAYGAYYKGNEWFISDIGSNTAANGVVRAELHRTRGIHLYGSSLNSATGFHLHGSGIDGQYDESAWQYGPAEYDMLTSVGDTVSAQSANWGGSALALSAGPGVKLEMSGNTLVASTDETVLWSGDFKLSATGNISLSESWGNFDCVKIYGSYNENNLPLVGEAYVAPFNGGSGFEIPVSTQGFSTWGSPSAFWVNVSVPCIFTSTMGVKVESSRLVGKWNNAWQTVNAVNGYAHIYKIVGVNRTAGV